MEAKLPVAHLASSEGSLLSKFNAVHLNPLELVQTTLEKEGEMHLQAVCGCKETWMSKVCQNYVVGLDRRPVRHGSETEECSLCRLKKCLNAPGGAV